MTTRHDVAARAGVSPSTVSRVVNGNGYVAHDVRFRVQRAIEELSYVPNRLARSLRMSQSMQIACITHNITNPFYGEIILGLEDVLFRSGYTLSLYTSNFTEQDYHRTVGERMYDGLVVLSPVELGRVVKLETLKEKIPMAVYWDFTNASPVSNVTLDLRTAMTEAVAHLLQGGHKRIVFLGHETEKVEENPRFQGYVDALASHGISLLKELILTTPSWGDSPEFGYEKMNGFLQRDVAFTALVASNDLLAYGAMRALSECGKRVPGDVSVIGFDDLDITRFATPALTTVHVPKRLIGERLGALLLQDIDGTLVTPSPIVLKAQLVCRETTKPIDTVTQS